MAAVRAQQPQQQSGPVVSRREAGLAAIAAVAAFANVAPAKALFGSEKKAEEEYQQKTVGGRCCDARTLHLLPAGRLGLRVIARRRLCGGACGTCPALPAPRVLSPPPACCFRRA